MDVVHLDVLSYKLGGLLQIALHLIVSYYLFLHDLLLLFYAKSKHHAHIVFYRVF